MTHSITPFSINCPTAIHFGVGKGSDVSGFLPKAPARVVFVQGASSKASAPVLATLQARGHAITIITCAGEPSIEGINTALEGIRNPTHIVACGGGSVIDTGKALAVLLEYGLTLPDDFANLPELTSRTRIRLIALPTTAGTGAEVTSNAVIDVPSKGAKISIRGAALFPDVAIIDPMLAQSAPKSVTLASGLDAVTQVIESYTSNAATPFSMALCRPAIPRGLRGLRNLIENPSLTAWEDMCWVSLSSGLALANSGLGAAHGLASVLGKRLAAPHGVLCGRLLVPTLRKNSQRSTEGTSAHDRIAECLSDIASAFPSSSATEPLTGFEHWIAEQALPRLSEYGMRKDQMIEFAELGRNASSSQKNAVLLDQADYVAILQEAF